MSPPDKQRTIWEVAGAEGASPTIQVIDQRHLPFNMVVEDLITTADVVAAIKDMHVRGAGLIGVTAGYGMYLATRQLFLQHRERKHDGRGPQGRGATRASDGSQEGGSASQGNCGQEGGCSSDQGSCGGQGGGINTAPPDAHPCGASSAAVKDFLLALRAEGEALKASRPTAVNLAWAVDRQLAAVHGAVASHGLPDGPASADTPGSTLEKTSMAVAGEEGCGLLGGQASGLSGDHLHKPPSGAPESCVLASASGGCCFEAGMLAALHTARAITEEDVAWCHSIGCHGARIIEDMACRKREALGRGQECTMAGGDGTVTGGDVTVNVLTHCNAGWLAFVEWGSATAPIYVAFERGIKLHVWVDETRPRSQGARLTSWELGRRGVPHTLIADNVGGHLMQHGMVDMVIVGSDRTTYTGDVANKIGTYLKALAAKDNGVPFYAALPSSTIDWAISDGVAQIPIEERGGDEVKRIEGLVDGKVATVLVTLEETPVANYGFDVTPARLVTGLITERGVCEASARGVFGLYPEKCSSLS